jgi:hypothetical protein
MKKEIRKLFKTTSKIIFYTFLILLYSLNGIGQGAFNDSVNFIPKNIESLDFPRKKFQKEFIVYNCIVGKTDFGSSEFNSGGSFNSNTFDLTTDFPISRFNKHASFMDSHFKGKANFGFIIFKGHTDYLGSQFDSLADFTETNYYRKAHFIAVKFKSTVDFQRSHFHSEAIFNSAKFGAFTNFERAVFDSIVDFRSVIFNGNVNFSQAVFRDFVDFDYARLPDTLVMDFAEINKSFDLSLAYNKKGFCHLSIKNTDVGRIKLNYNQFQLYFDPKDSIGYNLKESIYQSLLLNQKDYPDGYKKLDIEYKQFKYSSAGLLGYYLNLISCLWWNYGYDRQYILYWTIGFLMFFTILNYFVLDRLNNSIYTLENIPFIPKWISDRRIGNRLWYSFVYTSTIFFRLTLKLEKINIKNKSGSIYIILIYTLGLVCLAYIANFILQK